MGVVIALSSSVHFMNVLWKIFGMRFGLLVHSHVKVNVQVLSLSGRRSITQSSKTLCNDWDAPWIVLQFFTKSL